MGTTAEKLSACYASKVAMQNAISGIGYPMKLGDKFSGWPGDMQTVTLSGDIDQYQLFMSMGAKGTTAQQYNGSKSYAPKISSLTLEEGINIGNYGFAYGMQCNDNLKVLNFPKTYTFGLYALQNAFRRCNGLSGELSIDFRSAFSARPIAGQVFSNTFTSCDSIETLHVTFKDNTQSGDPVIGTIAPTMFAACRGLKDVYIHGLSAPFNVISVWGNVQANTLLTNCSALTSITVCDATAMNYDFRNYGGMWFSTGMGVTEVHLPNMISCNIGWWTTPVVAKENQSAFTNLKSTLRHIYLPKCQFISNLAFNSLTVTVHLNPAYESTISALENYENQFTGGTYGDVTLVFDQQ